MSPTEAALQCLSEDQLVTLLVHVEHRLGTKEELEGDVRFAQRIAHEINNRKAAARLSEALEGPAGR
jgi:hypothetical protein